MEVRNGRFERRSVVSEVPRLWFVIVKKTLFAINKSAKLHSPEKSRATDQLAVCSQHTLCITMRRLLRKSYEAGAELLPWRACDCLSENWAGIEKKDSCPVRHTHST